MKKFKITPLFIVLVFIEVSLIILSFNFLFLENKNGMLLGGLITFVFAVINFLLITIQQTIANIKGIKNEILWSIEILIIIVGIIYISKYGISIG